MERKKLIDRAKNIKAADKPRKAEKMYRPKGSGKKAAGVYAFWALMLAICLFMAILAANVMNIAKAPTVEELPPPNPAASQEAVDFAKGFAQTYFTWDPTAEGWEAQMNNLEPMLGEGVAETAGIVHSDQAWSSRPGNTRLLNIEEVGENKALITLEVDQTLKAEDDNGEEVTENATHFFTVPVAFNGSYAIYDLPSFTAVPAAHTVKSEKIKGDPTDAKTETDVKNFLTTFFQSYASDKPDKLSYFLEGFESVQGLEGSVEFVEVKNATIVLADAGTYDVQAVVTMKEPKTGSRFETNYFLTVKESDGRLVVTKLNQGGQ